MKHTLAFTSNTDKFKFGTTDLEHMLKRCNELGLHNNKITGIELKTGNTAIVYVHYEEITP